MLAFFAFIFFFIIPCLTLLSDPSGKKGDKYLEMLGLQSTQYYGNIPLDAINSPDYWKNESKREREIEAMMESNRREMEESNSQENKILKLSADLQSALGIKHVELGFSRVIGKKYLILSVDRFLPNTEPILAIFPGVSAIKGNRPFDGWYVSHGRSTVMLPPDSVQKEVFSRLQKNNIK
jgi:hypothetical protein